MLAFIIITVVVFLVFRYIMKLPGEVETPEMELLERLKVKFRDKDPENEFDASTCYVFGRALIEGVKFSQDVNKGLFLLQRAANYGYTPALVYLGDYYSTHDRSGASDTKIFNYYKQAADKGDKVGMSRLGLCYANGCGVEENWTEAHRWMIRSAELGYAPACEWMLGVYRDLQEEKEEEMRSKSRLTSTSGLSLLKDDDPDAPPVDPDYAEAMRLIEDAVLKYSHGDPDYQHPTRLFKGSIPDETFDEALRLLRQAADREYVPAMLKLAGFLLFDVYVPKEGWGDGSTFVAEGVRLATRALALGDNQAWIVLGNCSAGGIGVYENKKRAFDCYLSASHACIPEAFNLVGLCYSKGEGVEKNFALEHYYLKIGAIMKDPKAMIGLARCYYYGEGVAKDLEKAREYYEIAANLGSGRAAYILAYGYLVKNSGYEFDKERGLAWLDRAVNLSEERALTYLGRLYRTGRFVKQDLQAAHDCFIRAAQKNYAEAMFFLGYSFADLGRYQEALEWLKKAERRGYEHATELIGKVYEIIGYDESELS